MPLPETRAVDKLQQQLSPEYQPFRARPPSLCSHRAVQSGPGSMCTGRDCVIEEEPELREPKSFITGSEHA